MSMTSTTTTFLKECDSKRIAGVQVYRAKWAVTANPKRGLRFYNVFFLILYIYQIGWVLSTIGEPYRRFLEKADREGFQVMEGTTKLRAQLEHSFQDLNDPGRRTKKIGWTDWMDMDIEELAAEKKRDRERTVLDSLPKSMRVPHRYAASFWPTLLFGVIAVLHALVLLLQVWSVAFNVWINFQEVDADAVEIPASMLDIDDAMEEKFALEAAQNKSDATYCRVPNRVLKAIPPDFPTHARIIPGKGPHVLVTLEYFPVLGMTFEYNRRRFVYEQGVWRKIRCRTTFDLEKLHGYTGLTSHHRVVASQVRHGPNMFSVKQPTFMELYKKQLLNPFSVFQVFCVLLWAIDDYIVYSLFSLFMVLVFEGTVVMQRLKSSQALHHMGNPSRNVYVRRSNQWTVVDTTELLPGDIMSLTRVQPHFLAAGDNSNPAVSNEKKGNASLYSDEDGDIVPADLLLLTGSTVVNEASLTGESVPQMKEGLVELVGEMSMKNAHKMNVVYAGTKMLLCKGPETMIHSHNIPQPPDHGCVCFVLRTGFASAQGKLVRMIEGSQESVKDHERETGYLLLFLCFFAVLSSSYVLYHGMRDDNRSKYELLLHCILIVTSVIRPELPMQMALAVNNSLMTLMKLHVFCTEPYRVPMAGKLDACLFDKTGTLTTDQLVAVGVCEANKLQKNSDDDRELLTPMMQTHEAAAFVLAGCHSLVSINGETQGDPLESAALASMRWQVDIVTGRAVPCPATIKKPPGKSISVGGMSVNEVEIITRHHFSSKLQRMSCVVKANGRHFAVVKGSSEAVGRLLSNKPNGFDVKAEFFAKQGYRVIALAFKPLGSIAEAIESRNACEKNLEFAGFVAFTCMVRKDTASVLKRLKQGGMSVAMVTGDALLTAIHVAKEVNICEALNDVSDDEEQVVDGQVGDELKAFLESKQHATTARNGKVATKKIFKPIAYLETTTDDKLYWRSYDDGSNIANFNAEEIPGLAQKYELAMTGRCLSLAFEQDKHTGKVLGFIRVFARMTPDAKETVIDCLRSVGILSLMCGDGANDVGALKQADVGVALLSGFGNVNVEKTEEKVETKDDGVRAIMSEEHLAQIRSLPVRLLKMKIRTLGVDPDKYPYLSEKEDLVQLYQIKSRELAVQRHDQKASKSTASLTASEKREEQRREMQEKQRRLAERTAELEAQGKSFASFIAMKEFWAAEMETAKKKKAEMARFKGVEGSAANLVAQLEDMDMGDMPVVKLGDASIAAPFTSKMPSIRSCVDIVRQGRCTLVSSIQMYQIMALQCLISSYSLSVLYLDGVKYGDSQITAMGLLGSVSFMSVSRSRPLDKLSRVRPLNSIFHPALFVSLFGQFVIHLATMIIASQAAKKHLPEDYEPELDGHFKPGILNTVVFLVSNFQQVTVFFVNLQGRPFMTGVTENRPLLWSLVATFILTFMFASESVPGLNRYFQLVAFPDEQFRTFVLSILLADFLATFLFDRCMKFLFCRHILVAGLEETTSKDVFSLFKTFAIIGILMYWLMGDSDQWDVLLEMEQNMTLALNATSDGVEDGVSACVGAACEAIQETVQVIRDEF